jgi:hypothetical protein
MSLLCLPAGADMGLMQMMESYSLRLTPLGGTNKLQLLSNATVQPLHSATFRYEAWDLMVPTPNSICLDKQWRLISLNSNTYTPSTFLGNVQFVG